MKGQPRFRLAQEGQRERNIELESVPVIYPLFCQRHRDFVTEIDRETVPQSLIFLSVLTVLSVLPVLPVLRALPPLPVLSVRPLARRHLSHSLASCKP